MLTEITDGNIHVYKLSLGYDEEKIYIHGPDGALKAGQTTELDPFLLKGHIITFSIQISHKKDELSNPNSEVGIRSNIWVFNEFVMDRANYIRCNYHGSATYSNKKFFRGDKEINEIMKALCF